MEITEKRTVEEVREVLVGRKCDFCGRIVDKYNWFRVTTSHGEWGTDSGDSYEYRDACGPECVLGFAEAYVRKAHSQNPNTLCIEIEHKRSLW